MTENAPTGVTVTVRVGMATGKVRHEGADAIDIRDGHLFVTKNGATRTVEVYAPGKWITAMVD